MSLRRDLMRFSWDYHIVALECRWEGLARRKMWIEWPTHLEVGTLEIPFWGVAGVVK